MATRDLSRGSTSEQQLAITDGGVIGVNVGPGSEPWEIIIAWMRGRVAELGISGVVSERHLRAYLEHFGDPERAVEALYAVVKGNTFRV